MKVKLTVLVVAGVFVLASMPAVAHHAEVVYDTSRTISLKGTITKFLWTNPHATIHFQVKNGQGVEAWIAELSALGALVRAGWTKNTVKPGDVIEMISHPHKDGLRRVRFEKLMINGKVLHESAE